jgi:SanA protein
MPDKTLKKKVWLALKIAVLAGIVFSVALIFISDNLVAEKAEMCFSEIDSIGNQRVALVLGTAKYRKSGGSNLYYKYRIEAAAKLYHSGKAGAIICSGDNSTKFYDEPSAMKADLMKEGIPADKIYLDYAGFRTLDSVIRAKAIFSQDSLIVVSQPFHNERALYIAEQKGIDAIGFNAKKVSQAYGLKTQLREKLARVKTILDLHILGTEPKFYGEKVVVE